MASPVGQGSGQRQIQVPELTSKGEINFVDASKEKDGKSRSPRPVDTTIQAINTAITGLRRGGGCCIYATIYSQVKKVYSR